MDTKEMRFLVENYSEYIGKIEKIKEDLAENKNYTKITATYGHNTGFSSNSFSSKVENKAIEQIKMEYALKEYKRRVAIVRHAEKVLTYSEREIIEIMKLGFEKLSVIAQLLGKKKKYVFDARKRALKKMCEYIGDKYEL